MKNSGGPVKNTHDKIKNLVENAVEKFTNDNPKLEIDFFNTKIAFASRTDTELKHARRMFTLMSNPVLVNILSKLGLLALSWRLPLVQTLIQKTVFKLFVGGTTLLKSQVAIDNLFAANVQTILDYGAEAKTSEKEYNITMNETMRAIEFCANNHSAPTISTKVTGMARFALLEDVSKPIPFTKESRAEYKSVMKRLDSICHLARERGVSIYFDAEESWIQPAIDHMVNIMMRRYNCRKPVVYNTFQMYRHDRLEYLVKSYDDASSHNYILGAKIVRGAYMEKERTRAENNNEVSPINPSKEATNRLYNQAVRFCVDNYLTMASCNASHNLQSTMLQAQLIHERKIPKNHPNLLFCQLYGMSDNLTFNLAHHGFNAAKYLPYGSVKEVFPYLIRRAQENTSVTGDLGRELKLIKQELKRRKKSQL